MPSGRGRNRQGSHRRLRLAGDPGHDPGLGPLAGVVRDHAVIEPPAAERRWSLTRRPTPAAKAHSLQGRIPADVVLARHLHRGSTTGAGVRRLPRGAGPPWHRLRESSDNWTRHKVLWGNGSVVAANLRLLRRVALRYHYLRQSRLHRPRTPAPHVSCVRGTCRGCGMEEGAPSAPPQPSRSLA